MKLDICGETVLHPPSLILFSSRNNYLDPCSTQMKSVFLVEILQGVPKYLTREWNRIWRCHAYEYTDFIFSFWARE